MDWKRIKGANHINILIKDSTTIVTKENDYISTLEFQKLYEIATKFMDYFSNEMSRAEHSNHNSNQLKYPLLT